MKKLSYILCVLFFATTVYAKSIPIPEQSINEVSSDSNQEQYSLDILSVNEGGEIAYCIEQKEVQTCMAMLNTALENNRQSQPNNKSQGIYPESKPVMSYEYRIALHYLSKSDKETRIFFLYKTGKIVEIKCDNEGEETWISQEEMNDLIQYIKMLCEHKCKYDTFLPLTSTNINKLGCVLNGDLYLFKDAFIDSKGSLYISLDDWNSMFSPTYGNTKVLSMRGNEVIYHYKSTNIPVKMTEKRVYIPLRNAVDYFSCFHMDWDSQLKKVVISEKLTSNINVNE